MKPLALMVGVVMGGWLVATLVAPQPVNPEALAGVLGPLASAVISWWWSSRTYRAAPERLTKVMIGGFAAKAVFFATYLVVMVRGLGLGSMIFVVSFVVSFIVLHVIEAQGLKQLFTAAHGTPSGTPHIAG
jgi:hypothetical protein